MALNLEICAICKEGNYLEYSYTLEDHVHVDCLRRAYDADPNDPDVFLALAEFVNLPEDKPEKPKPAKFSGRQLFVYLLRWQVSSPVLAGCLYLLADWPLWVATVIANLIGGLLFFPADGWIFTKLKKWGDSR